MPEDIKMDDIVKKLGVKGDKADLKSKIDYIAGKDHDLKKGINKIL